jgi:hypothetical protein
MILAGMALYKIPTGGTAGGASPEILNATPLNIHDCPLTQLNPEAIFRDYKKTQDAALSLCNLLPAPQLDTFVRL